MSLLIVIPSKIEVAQYYRDRVVACSETWLKDCPCDFKLFSDADLGVSGDQYNLENDPIRTLRTKAMCKYAFDRGYDHLFRCDTDTYVWTNRLLACGFEQHDYIGYCHAIPRHVEVSAGRGLNTAHGGAGFFLSRKAMQLVVDAPVARCGDGRFWGDIYTGEVLWEHGIYCHRDLRFVEANGRHKTHDGNVFADEIPENHGCITIHPVPAANMKGVYNQFPSMSAETAPLDKQPWDI